MQYINDQIGLDIRAALKQHTVPEEDFAYGFSYGVVGDGAGQIQVMTIIVLRLDDVVQSFMMDSPVPTSQEIIEAVAQGIAKIRYKIANPDEEPDPLQERVSQLPSV